MSPTDTISNLLQVNRGAAKFIFGGLGLFAAAAIVISWGSGSFDDLKIGAVYILAFAICVAILAMISSNRMMKTVIGWILIVAFGAWTLGLVGSFFSAITNVPANMPSPACYLRMHMEPPDICETRLRDTDNDLRIGTIATPPSAPLPTLFERTGTPRLWQMQNTEESPATTTHEGAVFIQFADPIQRPAMVDLAASLVDLNWRVEGAELGGDKVREGPDTNEVRYFKEADREVAIDLATTIHTLHPDQPIYVRDFTRLGAFVRPGTLEIWITQPLDPPVES